MPAFRTDPSALWRRRLIAIGLGLPACMSRPADAQGAGWPDRPVRLVVPFPPGCGTDALARILATVLSRGWGC